MTFIYNVPLMEKRCRKINEVMEEISYHISCSPQKERKINAKLSKAKLYVSLQHGKALFCPSLRGNGNNVMYNFSLSLHCSFHPKSCCDKPCCQANNSSQFPPWSRTLYEHFQCDVQLIQKQECTQHLRKFIVYVDENTNRSLLTVALKFFVLGCYIKSF